MVSHYKQATLLDCGMACVKTIISYYFPKLEHLDSLQFDNNNYQGLSLFDIEDILKRYGMMRILIKLRLLVCIIFGITNFIATLSYYGTLGIQPILGQDFKILAQEE